jgi:putative spermidine/putrescine transport system permease protein
MNRTRESYLLVSPALLVFVGIVAIPLLMTFLLAFHEWHGATGIVQTMGIHNFVEILTDRYFIDIFLRTLRISLLVTLICIAIGVPEAYILKRMRDPWRSILVFVVIAPLLISVVARTLGWALILAGNGLISGVLQKLGLVAGPVSLMYTEAGIVISMVHVLIPFMVLTVWASLGRMEPATEQAALSLGACQFTIFFRVVLPQAMPGILSGGIVIFTLTASAFATPAIIGGRRLKTAATAVYDEFLHTLNWPLGAAVAVLLLVAIVVVIVGCNRLIERRYSQVFSQ